jgi:5-methyltetrahydropteroyltriglutamate--homocysteine methyltransferase
MLTTVIGSYPKPSFLKLPDWFNAKGGTDTKHPTEAYNNAIKSMGDEAESIFLKAAKEVIEDQIECGIDIVTDGEVRRENYIHYHCRHLEGIDFNKLTKKIARTGNYECWLPTITNKVEAKDSFLVHDWSVAQNISSQPVKITMPGPMTITDTIANDYYTSNRELGEDLAKAINFELNRLVDVAKKNDGESVLITFEPHPRMVLHPEDKTIEKNVELYFLLRKLHRSEPQREQEYRRHVGVFLFGKESLLAFCQ